MSKKYTKEEIGKHNKEGDCWIIIEDKVYDVSNYTEHPGGFDLLRDESGPNKDATEAYEDAEHTKTAQKKLKEFLIGEVGEAAPAVQEEAKQATPKASATPTQAADLPEGARHTPDVDCVLITDPMAYRGTIVRLAAVHMGIKWKHHAMSISNEDQFQPWYLKINPKAYFPTMIVQGQKPVCESVDIIEYMDKNFKGKISLLQGQTEAVKAKYLTLKNLHQKWDVEQFTVGTAMKQNFYINMLLPYIWMNGIRRVEAMQKKSPTFKGVLYDKLKVRYEQTNNFYVNPKMSLETAKKDANQIFDVVEKWLGEGESMFALGTKTLTLGDVLLQCVLGRVYMNQPFFNEEISNNKRPLLYAYWNRNKSDPNIKKANVMVADALASTSFQISAIIVLVTSIISLIMAYFVEGSFLVSILFMQFMTVFGVFGTGYKGRTNTKQWLNEYKKKS